MVQVSLPRQLPNAPAHTGQALAASRPRGAQFITGMQKKSDKGCGIDIFKIQRNGAAVLSIQPAFTVPSQTSDTIGQRGDAAGAGIATPGCTSHDAHAPLIPQRTDYLLLSPSNRHQEIHIRPLRDALRSDQPFPRKGGPVLSHSATRTMFCLTGPVSPLLGTGLFWCFQPGAADRSDSALPRAGGWILPSFREGVYCSGDSSSALSASFRHGAASFAFHTFRTALARSPQGHGGGIPPLTPRCRSFRFATGNPSPLRHLTCLYTELHEWTGAVHSVRQRSSLSRVPLTVHIIPLSSQ